MTPFALNAGIQGMKVLVVESEFLLSPSIYRDMEVLGAEIIGPVGFVEDVQLIVAGNRPDCAIVDGRLDGRDREAVLGLLRRMQVPFVEACGRSRSASAGEEFFPLADGRNDLAPLGQT